MALRDTPLAPSLAESSGGTEPAGLGGGFMDSRGQGPGPQLASLLSRVAREPGEACVTHVGAEGLEDLGQPPHLPAL